MKNRAKKISSGNYSYKGYRIERVNTYNGSVQWNVFEMLSESAEDCADTLRGARYLIDRITENK